MYFFYFCCDYKRSLLKCLSCVLLQCCRDTEVLSDLTYRCMKSSDSVAAFILSYQCFSLLQCWSGMFSVCEDADVKLKGFNERCTKWKDTREKCLEGGKKKKERRNELMHERWIKIQRRCCSVWKRIQRCLKGLALILDKFNKVIQTGCHGEAFVQ